MRSERGALWFSTITALIIGCIGISVSLFANSQAILLDGLFNICYFIIALFSIKVSGLLALPDSEEFPLGYSYFEPLVNGSKGVLIFGISMLALFDAVGALLKGGRVIEAGVAIGYGIFATLACSSAAVLLNRAYRRTASPLVGVDAESWKVNALISVAVLVVFAAIPAVEALGGAKLVPYVDPFLVSVVVVISIAIPVRIAWQALMAMLNRAPARNIREPVTTAIRDSLSELPARAVHVRMLQPGQRLYVVAHVLLPEDYSIERLRDVDEIRARVRDRVRALHKNALVDVLFTGDAQWATVDAATGVPETVGAGTSP